MTAFQRFIHKIASAGSSKSDSYELVRRKEFFNVILLLGAMASVPLALIGFRLDFYAGFFHLVWGISFVLAFVVHRFISFNIARFLALISAFVFGTLAAALVGHESYPHIGSLIILVGVFIIHDPKKEWLNIIFYSLLQVGNILLIESNYLKLPNAPETATFLVRAGNFIGATVFITIELIYFFQVISKSERNANRELMKSNANLNLRNQEKDLLLKEIHHRVKNNLQIVSSLLRLQSHEITDEASREKFMDSVNRIKSISNLHETIYKSDNMLNIDLSAYLQNLAFSLIESYSIEKEIELDIQSDLIHVENDHIVPISLILNEMISNSLKHGFANSESGKISVSIVHISDHTHYRLHYYDSGQWVNSQKGNSFGIELIESLVDQLNGTIETRPNSERSDYSILFQVLSTNRI